MPLPLVLFVVAASAHAGFQWTVHVVVYRQFAAVPADAFPVYGRLHRRRISYLVGPLFAALISSTAGCCSTGRRRFRRGRRWWPPA